MIVVGEWTYYDDFGSIYAIKTDGSGNRKISINEDKAFLAIVDGDWIYYISSARASDGGSETYAIKTDGTGRRKVSDEQLNFSFAIDEWIYWFIVDVDHNDKWIGSRICAIKTDGSDEKTIL